MTEWYARFVSDVRFRADVSAAYDGRHEVGDALWWLDHPDDDAPSGAVSARRRLVELQRAAYSRGGDSSAADESGGAVPAQLELTALHSQLAADRSAALAAAARAERSADSSPARSRTVLDRRVLGGRIPRVGVIVVAGVLAVAAAGAIVIGTGALRGSRDGGAVGSDAGAVSATSGVADGGSSYSAGGRDTDPGGGDGSGTTGGALLPGESATADPFAGFPAGTGENAYARVFSRDQSASDFPPQPLPPNMRGDTFRSLSAGQYTRGSAYAAISRTDEICLVVYGNGTDYGLTCATVDVVAARGLQVSLVTTDSKDPVTGAPIAAIGVSARWRADGTFALDASTPYDRD